MYSLTRSDGHQGENQDTYLRHWTAKHFHGRGGGRMQETGSLIGHRRRLVYSSTLWHFEAVSLLARYTSRTGKNMVAPLTRRLFKHRLQLTGTRDAGNEITCRSLDPLSYGYHCRIAH